MTPVANRTNGKTDKTHGGQLRSRGEGRVLSRIDGGRKIGANIERRKLASKTDVVM